MRLKPSRSPLGLATVLSAIASASVGSAAAETPGIQHFNVRVFGKSSERPIKLLLPRDSGEISPETVMVDVGDDDRFYAATVRYPKSLTLAAARAALNTRYKKWERKSFANDPRMGIWRNDSDKFSIQLTEDDDNVVVIYIKFDLLPRRAEQFVADALREALKDATPEELDRLPEALEHDD